MALEVFLLGELYLLSEIHNFFNFQVVSAEEYLKSQTILSYTKLKEEIFTTGKVYDFDKGHVGATNIL